MKTEEIIKALECCIDDTDDICQQCPLCDDCLANMDGTGDIKQLALDLIIRQKAEIERLKEKNNEQPFITNYDIDNLLKELVGEGK